MFIEYSRDQCQEEVHKRHILLTGEKECTVEDTFLEVLEGVFTRNFRNVTEMEAVMRVGATVLCAVKDLDVVVQLHPSVTNHRTFTDFLFVIKDTTQAICFIEVKKATDSTSLTLQADSTAQALREAHILIANNTDESATIPFLLTNSLMWSFGVAAKRSSKIAVISTFDFYSMLSTVAEWKSMIHIVRLFIKGELFQ